MKSLKHNVVMNIILSISTVIFPVITYPYVARTLLVEANGRLSFAQSVINYFSLFATLGLTTYGIKACAQVRDNRKELSKRVHELIFINIFTTAVVLIVLVGAIIFSPKLRHEYVLLLIYSLNLVLNVVGMNWLYSALEKYDYITIRSIAFKFISLILMFIFVHNPEDCYIYAIITVFANVGSHILNIYNSRKYINYKWYGDYHIKQHLKPTLTMFSTLLAVNVYTNLGNVMLGFVKGDYEVGIYNTAVRIQSTLSSVVVSIGNVLMPRLSYYVQKGKEQEFFDVLRKSYKVLLMIAVPVAMYFILFAKESVLLIAGKAYLDAVVPVQIIMFTIVTAAMSNIIGVQIFIPLGKESSFMKAVITGACVNLVLNVVLMPIWGTVGVALATLSAQITQFIVQMIQGWKYLHKIFEIRSLLVIVITAIFSGVVAVTACQFISLNVFWMFCASAGIFFATYALILWVYDYKEFTETIEQFTKGKIRRHRNV